MSDTASVARNRSPVGSSPPTGNAPPAGSSPATGNAPTGNAPPAKEAELGEGDEVLQLIVGDRRRASLKRSFPVGVSVTLGRDASCHILLSGSRISRRHLRLEMSADSIFVVDSSANGCEVNGARLHGEGRTFNDQRLDLKVGSYLIRAVRHRVRAVEGRQRRLVHQKLLERLDLHQRRIGDAVSDALRTEVASCLREIVAEPELSIDEPIRERLVREIQDEALGLGPLEALLADADVSEIMVVDAGTIYAERAGKLQLTGRRFTDDEAVRSAIERIVTPLGRRIDESCPLVDARLADGSRVNAVIPPLALRGPCITIRKFPERRLCMADLVAGDSLNARMASFLERSVALRKNIVISGGTGSGKTTLLNLLSAAVGASERIVTIEDAAELALAQPHVVGLEAKPPNLEGQGEFTIRDLLKNALRMRPDRIVVGECRGGEALDMLQAMNTGHEGSMTTTHANTPRQALERIETLCLMGGIELPLSALRRQIASSVDLVVQQARLAGGARKITSVTEVVGLDRAGAIETRELFRFEGGTHVATGFMPSYLAQLERSAAEGEVAF